jgi:glycosyltransferase involved in cell wall biosynthesis
MLASPKEGWGISNLEAAACGTPVIAADAPGIRESVVDGETGFLVPPNDIDAMAAAMRGIVVSRDLVDVLGAAGRRFAETFTWERAARETLSHLEEVVAR